MTFKILLRTSQAEQDPLRSTASARDFVLKLKCIPQEMNACIGGQVAL
jgi:hypothetical protein